MNMYVRSLQKEMSFIEILDLRAVCVCVFVYIYICMYLVYINRVKIRQENIW